MAIDPVSLGVSLALSAASMAFTAMQHIEGPRLTDLKTTVADYGTPLNYFYGVRAMGCPCFFAEPLKEEKVTHKTKGGKYSEYKYSGTWAIHVADHKISRFRRVWFDNHLVYDATQRRRFDIRNPPEGLDDFAFFMWGIFAFIDMKNRNVYRYYYGTEDQEPDPRMLATVEAQHGEGTCPAYRGQAYIFFEDIPLEKMGNRLPQVRVEAETGTFSADVIDGLDGGYNEDGGGYAYIMNSPDKSRSVLSHGLLSSGRFVSIENQRGAYNPIEREPAGPFGSAAFIDNNGYVYGSSQDGRKTWKFAPDGTRTQVGTDDDLPLNSPSTPIFHLAGLYEVGGVDTLFYACASSGATGVIYSRPTSGGPVVEHVSEDDTGTALPRARFMTQDAAGNVWAVSQDPDTNPVSKVYFWCVSGPAEGDYHIVTGFPALSAGATGNFVWPTYHDGYFYVMWGTSSSARHVVKVNATTFTVAGSVNIITAVGVTPGNASHSVYLGAGAPTIDTERGHLIVIEYTTGADKTVHRIDLATLTRVTETVDGWPASVALTTWPPVASASDPDVVYPRYTSWHDPIGGLLALPESGDFISSYPDPVRYAYPPDFAFLFMGDGVTLGEIFTDLSLRSKLTEEDFDFTDFDQQVRGFSWTQGSGKQIAGWLLDTYDSDIVPHDFKIVGKKRGSSPAGIMQSSEFVKADDRYTIPVTSETDVPRRMFFTYADTAADQNPNTVIAQRLSDATQSVREISLNGSPLAMSATEAQQTLDRFHRRTWFGRTEAMLGLTRRYLAVEPGDVWAMDFDGDAMTMRCTKIAVGANGILASEWKRDDPVLASLSARSGAGADGYVPPVLFNPVDSVGDVLDLPLLSDTHDQVTPFAYLVAGPAQEGTWPGASFSHSDSGEADTFTEAWDAVVHGSGSIFGEVTGTLNDAEPWIFDEGSEISVVVKSGALVSATNDDLLTNGAVNLALIGDELVQFRTATMTAPLTYTLTGFLRGVRGTEQHIGGHEDGEQFILLSSPQIHTMGASEIGDTDSYIVSTISTPPLQERAFDLLFNANAHRPYAPVHGTLTEDSGDILIDAVRRSRIGGSSVSGGDVPLGEVSEAWEADIFDGATFKRTIAGTSLPLTYTAAQQSADAVSDLVVKLYQMNPALGLRGFPLTIT